MNASIVADYLAKITTLFKTGQTTEHSFRPALQDLFNAINPEVQAVNEPKGIKVGRPATADPRGQSPLFYISISKMIIMSFATLGLFQVYWMYKQWIAIKYYEGRHIRPMWRAMFGIIWIFPLAVKMTSVCRVHGLHKPPIPLLFFALALFVITVISLSPYEGGPLIVLFIAAVGTLTPFQLTANRVAKHAMPNIASPRYSGLDKTALGFGVLFLALLMTGLSLELHDQ